MKPRPVLAGLLFLGFSTYATPNGAAALPKPEEVAVRADTGLASGPVQTSPSSDSQQKLRSPKTPDVRTSTAAAGSTASPAWQWNDEDRVRTRFDPTAVRERAAAHAASIGAQPSVHSQAVPSNQIRSSQHVLDGSRTPELFLPAELLDVLLQGLHSDPMMRTPARLALAKGIHEMGYAEDDFWSKLQRLSAPYLALETRPSNKSIQRVRTPDGKVASFPIDVERCVARHELLQSARSTFGAEKFQRFLYAAVAPEVQRSDETRQVDPAQELLFVAKGCHP